LILLTLYYLMKMDLPSFFFSSRRRHTRSKRDWSSDVCSSDLSLFCFLCPIDVNIRRFFSRLCKNCHMVRSNFQKSTVNRQILRIATFFQTHSTDFKGSNHRDMFW